MGASSHEEISTVLTTILNSNPALGWHSTGRSNTLRLGKMSRGMGEFHHDARTGLGAAFRIQKAQIGSGKIWLASVVTGVTRYHPLEEEADADFQHGKVNPLIIATDAYTTFVDPNDNIIFPTELSPNSLNSMAKLVWHRFDTSSSRKTGCSKSYYTG